jgi:hypothetical protein
VGERYELDIGGGASELAVVEAPSAPSDEFSGARSL